MLWQLYCTNPLLIGRQGWRGDGGVHNYNNHSFKMDVFDFGIILYALVSFQTMLLMNKNQSVAKKGGKEGEGGWMSAYLQQSFFQDGAVLDHIFLFSITVR